ncbi:hypothetical protein ALI22I_23910 [Saccharothrix sp. ALI-22-I]|uniref:helix-turn-helix domain-containing protein n=1 Tax=Saccharothrix sp. ALI-22-I TaxID=1933778 RepID=UPI0009C60B21|nr:helix-turn-helix transcriptional regulator [Saccharothrix sp. ALI-22-I]ONI86678.1 hypothetical protein ALI22I_23910 [Saccharothrix sp. ALI-22-I]
MSTSSAPQHRFRKSVTTVADFRAELLRLCNRRGRPLTVEEMSRLTGRPATLFRHFLRGGTTLPEWQTVQAVLTATGETSPQAVTAWKRRWAALERDSGGKADELARRHRSRRRARLPNPRSTQVYDDLGTYATDNPDPSWPLVKPAIDAGSLDGGVVADTPLNNAIAATTSTGYVAALAELHRAAGLSYADVAARSGGGLSKSSAHRIATGHGTGDRLPAKRSTLAAYLTGCGVTRPLERRLWLDKWEQLRRTPSALAWEPSPAREVRDDSIGDRTPDAPQPLPEFVAPSTSVMVLVDDAVLADEVHREPEPERRFTRWLRHLPRPPAIRHRRDRRSA